MTQAIVRLQAYEPTSDAVHGIPLPSHTDRSGSAVHGSRSIGLGSAFAIVGATIVILTWIDRLAMSQGVPEWLGPLMGALFAIAGMSFVVHGVAGIRMQRRVQRLRSTHVREPWVWDHPWDDHGSRDDCGRRIGRAIWFTGFLALFLIPFNWVGFFSPDRPIIFALVALLMDAMLIASGCGWCTSSGGGRSTGQRCFGSGASPSGQAARSSCTWPARGTSRGSTRRSRCFVAFRSATRCTGAAGAGR